MRKFLVDLFDTAHGRLMKLAEAWQRHTNRRTILTAVFLGTTMATLYISVMRPPDGFPINELVTIPEGAPLSEAAAVLEEAHIVRSGLVLKLLIILTGQEGNVHAGDYLFREPKDVFAIARTISIGAFGLEPIRFRVPEGATAREMAAIFGASLQRFDEQRFLANAQPLEGYLFPDTYFFRPNANDVLVLSTMRQNFEMKIQTLNGEIVMFGKPLRDVVVMASLLEREAQKEEDRRKIAGVLWNRLERGMLLQVDAAFLYTLGKGSFQLTVGDLTSDSPYNTYRHKGLPPGPIGSPSLDSLLAAVTPIKSDYLYYLADHNNITHYSRTYEEHLRKKRQYLGT